MSRIWLAVGIALACAFLQACGTVPSMMARPSQVGNSPVYVVASGAAGAIPVARSASGVHNQLKAFETTWRSQGKSLRSELSAADNLQFASLVWSTYKVATGHLHDAKWGAAAAGGIGLFESKYQLEVQASDYGNAAAAMSCLQSKFDTIPDGVWSEGYDKDTGVSAIKSVEDFGQQFNADPTDVKTISDWNTYRLIWSKVNDRLNAIDARLSDQLDHIRIGIPSSDELSKAFSGGPATSVGAGTAPNPIASLTEEELKIRLQKSPMPAITKAMMADLIDLPKQMDTCVAAMGK